MELLREYKFHIEIEEEDDGSITAYESELALVENAENREICINKMIKAMKDYAQDYYNEFGYWSKAPNRTAHIPYVLKLLINSDDSIAEDIICQDKGHTGVL